MKRHGSALILIIVIIAFFSTLGALFARIVYNDYAGANARLLREQAFYLAEAGLEKGKVELIHNPNWYTDLPYYLDDNASWLTKFAQGLEMSLGDGSFKIVREKGKHILYSIGVKGKGLVILKIYFEPYPYKTLAWREL